MAAQIPIKGDPLANDAALDKVRADKLREVTDGHDGTWMAHPGLLPVARAVFDAHMSGPNQPDRKREDVRVSAADLLSMPNGPRTEGGMRHNIRVGVQYLEAWLQGNGCVPLYYLMEDAATAEICRAQLWQWRRHGATLSDGRPVTAARLRQALREEMHWIRTEVGPARFSAGRYLEARDLFEALVTDDTFVEFLTLPAYDRLIDAEVSDGTASVAGGLQAADNPVGRGGAIVSPRSLP
jgi:malate synthase